MLMKLMNGQWKGLRKRGIKIELTQPYIKMTVDIHKKTVQMNDDLCNDNKKIQDRSSSRFLKELCDSGGSKFMCDRNIVPTAGLFIRNGHTKKSARLRGLQRIQNHVRKALVKAYPLVWGFKLHFY